MSDYVKAWQCIGCGRIDGPQTCVGICQDRKVEFVYASQYESVSAELLAARQQLQALEGLVRRLASTHPHKDGWEHSYLAMQDQARALVGGVPPR